jgi:aspartate-semialdehyde dehydrogenase
LSPQAASGAGSRAAEELRAGTEALLQGRPAPAPEALPQPLGFNVFPQIGPVQEMGYTSEEWKLVKETHKILHDNRIAITPTAVRVPVVNAHSESVYFETESPSSLEEIRELWRKGPGIQWVEEPGYPMPVTASSRDEVFVGRLRADPTVKNAYSCWIVSDNLRKGAALNAVQIAECLIR